MRPRSAMGLAVIAVLGGGAAVCVPGILAQNAKPDLGTMLKRLEGNLRHYDASLPSLFCDEEMVALLMQPGERDDRTVTDSVFRLKREAASGSATALVESREVETVDGRPASSQHVHAPTVLSGLFEGGLDVVSLSQANCMNYALERSRKQNGQLRFVVGFSTFVPADHAEDCFLQEASKGRVFIDPATMQVARLEITTPHHVIEDGDAYSPQVIGRRELEVDYAPVELGGESFWLPSTITMRNLTGSGFHQTVWFYRATYKGYRRLRVTSHIVDDAGKP